MSAVTITVLRLSTLKFKVLNDWDCYRGKQRVAALLYSNVKISQNFHKMRKSLQKIYLLDI